MWLCDVGQGDLTPTEVIMTRRNNWSGNSATCCEAVALFPVLVEGTFLSEKYSIDCWFASETYVRVDGKLYITIHIITFLGSGYVFNMSIPYHV
jgi:hypothetical protein